MNNGLTIIILHHKQILIFCWCHISARLAKILPLVHCSWSQLNIWTQYRWLAHCVWLFCCPSVCCLDSTSNWFSILAIQLASKTNSYPYFFILTSFTPLSVGISSNHPYWALEQGGNSNLHLGSFKNYVDKFLAIFDHLSLVPTLTFTFTFQSLMLTKINRLWTRGGFE